MDRLTTRYPPATRGTLVLWGLLAAFPFGGMTWQVLHHLVGLRRLGFDVWYVEDSERELLSAIDYEPTEAWDANVAYLRAYLEPLGFADRWVVRPPGQTETVGARDRAGLRRLYGEADAVLNLCGGQEMRPDLAEDAACLVYLQTDPVSDQVRLAAGDPEKVAELREYDHLFTYGTNLGASDCPVPLDREWEPTLPPVVVDWWRDGDAPRATAPLTTIAKWRHTRKDVTWDGEVWRWSKDVEFRRFLGVAARSPLPLELAVSSIDEHELDELRRHGWRTIPSATVKDPPAYREYIRRSRGEFSVAKEQYVRTRSGWFSDRSVCYLAAGRPVVVQETGFSRHVPTGEGLLAFDDEDGALAALETVAAEPERHAAAARELAADVFAAEKVLGDLLTRIGLR
jgi:hypothetical protein